MDVKKRNHAILMLVVLTLVLLAGIALELIDGRGFTTVSGDSMQHSDDGRIGIVDDRDGVVYEEADEYMTYFEGRALNRKSGGDYGDMVLFSVNDGRTRFVHRLVLYFRYNRTTSPATADIPELGRYNLTKLAVEGYGFDSHTFLINFTKIYERMVSEDRLVLEGYITKGDNRRFVDQEAKNMFVAPVPEEDILGVCTPVDNEMVRLDIPAYVSMLAPLLMYLILYGLWMLQKWKGGASPSHRTGVWGVLVISLAVPFIYIIGLLRASDVGALDFALGAAGYVIPAVVLTAVGKFGRPKASWRNDRGIIPATYLVLLAGASFLIKSGILPFSQSMFYLITVNYIFHIDPDRFLAVEEWKKDVGVWLVWLFPGVLLYLVTVTITLPPYVYLAVGWAAALVFFSSRIYKTYKSQNTDIPNE